MSTIRSPSAQKIQAHIYDTFMGLDDSRDYTAQDTGQKQSLIELNNGFCDWRGQIVREPPAIYRMGKHIVEHMRFYAPGALAYVERNAAALSFDTDRGHRVDDVFPPNAVIASAVFNRRLFFFARALGPYRYDGVRWQAVTNSLGTTLRPAYATVVQRRLAVAGIPGFDTIVQLSRVDNETSFAPDESPSEESVLRAGFIDIANVVNSAERITGLGCFEKSRLVVFTSDQAVIYVIDPNLENWSLDERSTIEVGCLSHNTIQNAGTDLLFCSKTGVYSVRRAQENGITVYSVAMSDSIGLTYRKLVARMDNPERISATWDQETGRYHIFFPYSDGVTARLTLTLPKDQEVPPKWSSGTHLNARCGAASGGRLVWGTAGGVYEVYDLGSEPNPETTPSVTMTLTTPLLWLGSMHETKEVLGYTLQAAGEGMLDIEVLNENGDTIHSEVIEVFDEANDFVSAVPLGQQYRRKLEARVLALQFIIRATGTGLFRIAGLGVTTRK